MSDTLVTPRQRRTDTVLTRGTAMLLVAFGLLPLAQWIPGGLSDPAYAHRWAEWGYGTVVCAGSGIVFAILARNRIARLPLQRHWWFRIVAVAEAQQNFLHVVLAGACFAVYALIARSVFSAKPLLIDELVQVLQARMYVSGHLWLPADSSREFFSILHMVDIGDRVYSQFPPGWPVMLMLGVVTHTVWLVGPLCGAVSVWVFAKLLRRAFPQHSILSVVGASLFGLAPFAAFQFSSLMSHGPVLMWLLIAILALSHATESGGTSQSARSAWAFVMGVASGCAFAVRPLDAVAFGIPAGAWLTWRTTADRMAARMLVMAAMGLAIPVIAVAWVNLNTTGSPFLFGYEALWGASHGLGFHAAPWGEAHTPQRGIELLSAYATRLNVYLFETPFPSLLPVIVALWFTTRLTTIERYLFAATLLHALMYFAYWHDGFFLGPRFVVPWLPLLIFMSVRLGLPSTWRRWGLPVRSGLAGGLGAGILVTLLISVPARIAQYRAGLTSMREDYTYEAKRAGVTDALVFVRESWGAQLIARLWALGVSRSTTAALYEKVDACVLEHATSNAERAATRGASLEAALIPLMRDSLFVGASSVSPDSTERMRSGMRYDEVCSEHVAADREGYALYPPLLLERGSGNIYVRDFQERDTVILRRYPNRPAFLLRRDGVDGPAPLRWIPLRTELQAAPSNGTQR